MLFRSFQSIFPHPTAMVRVTAPDWDQNQLIRSKVRKGFSFNTYREHEKKQNQKKKRKKRGKTFERKKKTKYL